MTVQNLVIIGSGPSGYSAAIYAARAELNPVLFEGFMSGVAGGQLMTTTEVENFAGFPDGITGPELMDNFKKQAIKFGTKVLAEDVLSVDLSNKPFKITGSKTQIETNSIIIATGATAKRLDIEGTRDNEFWQKGVTACAVCDGAAPIFRNKDLFVIGGGDSAVEEAIFLTKFAKKVYIVHRRDELRASKIMAKRAKEHPKVEILWNSVLSKVKGDTVVREVIINDVITNNTETKEAGGVFFAIGHQPNVDFLEGQLKLQENGFIFVEKGRSITSAEGVFAAGDVCDSIYKQAITAAGTGCMAALDVEKYLSENGFTD
jgi:thioredoxin reductase (NADPH)